MTKDKVVVVATAEQVEQAVRAARIAQHQQDVEWLKTRCVIPDFIATISAEDWQAFKNLPIE